MRIDVEKLNEVLKEVEHEEQEAEC